MKRILFSNFCFAFIIASLFLGNAGVMATSVTLSSTTNINSTKITNISVIKGNAVSLNSMGYLTHAELTGDNGTVFTEDFPYSDKILPSSIYTFETSNLAYGYYTLNYKIGTFDIIKILKQQDDGTWQYEYTYSYKYSLQYSVKIDLTHTGGHVFADTVIAATCTEAGYTIHKCSVCGYSYTDSLTSALGHDFSIIVTPATCVKEGYTTHLCSRCGYSYVDNITPALGHTSSDWIVDAQPTYNSDGLEHKECVVCGAILESKIIPKLIWENTFNDVAENSWYFSAVAFAVTNNLFYGTGTNTFSPDESMTRAMLVTVLYRLNGKLSVTGNNPFTDVENGKWYTDAIIWADENGIVAGVGNNCFNPAGNITREQMAAILYRYAKNKGYNVSDVADISIFPDSGEVSNYAVTALQWAYQAGIIKGTISNGNVLLDPKGNAARAQVASILMRFVNNVK